MASGWAKSSVESGPHWDDALAQEGKLRTYVEYDFECLLDPEVDELLTLSALRGGSLDAVRWTPQGSGILLPDETAEALEKLWESHTSKPASHRQFIDLSGALEGKISVRMVIHRQREQKLRVAKLKAARHAGNGKLCCEVPRCGFDFEDVYGKTGFDYAQVHHLKPLSDRSAPSLTELSDLAIVCANCHAMIHRGGACRPLDSLIEK